MSRMSDLTCASPPTSSQVTVGIRGAPMASEYDARALFRATSKSLAVSGIFDWSALGLLNVQLADMSKNDVTDVILGTFSKETCRARATRLARSEATKAAVCVAIEAKETSGASIAPSNKAFSISYLSASLGAFKTR